MPTLRRDDDAAADGASDRLAAAREHAQQVRPDGRRVDLSDHVQAGRLIVACSHGGREGQRQATRAMCVGTATSSTSDRLVAAPLSASVKLSSIILGGAGGDGGGDGGDDGGLWYQQLRVVCGVGGFSAIAACQARVLESAYTKKMNQQHPLTVHQPHQRG